MSRARLDLEKDKFDSEGRVKVSIEANNSTAQDQDVVVKNTSADPVPVSIVNPDANIDLQVEIQPNITIDDSTPIDTTVTNTSLNVNITALDGDGDLGVKVQNTTDINVNVTNSSFSTNATIQNSNLDVNLTDLDINGRLPVSVDNTADVNVTNTSLNTNATIQNSNIDVNLTDLNVSSQLPVSVDNQPTVTVDDSTPVDINLTNASINTNATIQGTPTVTISGDVSINDATAIRVDLTNANIATNATIQNSSLDTHQMTYDGSSWVNQLSDSNGKAIVLEKKYYSASDITALGSSISVREWLNAYADGILTFKYVGSYHNEFESEVYLTHQDLGDSNKCLKLIYDYSTENTLEVVKSVYADVVDWPGTNLVTGELTVTLGTVTSPDPNSAIAVGTDICTIAVGNTGQGSITIDLSGTNASLYTLRNVTDGTTGSSLAYDAAKSFVLETLSDFSGASYSHSVTITATNNLYGNTDSENVATSGTFTTAPAFANEKYYKASTATGLTDAVRDLVLAGTNKNPFADNNNMPSLGDAFSMSFYLQVPSTATTFDPVIAFSASDTRKHVKIFHLNGKFTVGITAPLSAVDYSFSHTTYNTWQHFVITKKAVAPRNPNYDSTDYFLQVYIDGTPQNPSVSFWDNSPAFTTTLWDNESVSEVYISGPARNYGTNNAYASSKSGRQWKVDELAFYSKELSQSEVNTIYNSGTAKDLMDLNSSFNLSKYFRFGDHASDVTTTGSIECYDEVLDTVYFEDNGGTIENY